MAISRISEDIVAEKSNACLFLGTLARMKFMSRMKPMSSIRSASSRTITDTWERSRAFRFIRSFARPGVAITISIPRFSLDICGSIPPPP